MPRNSFTPISASLEALIAEIGEDGLCAALGVQAQRVRAWRRDQVPQEDAGLVAHAVRHLEAQLANDPIRQATCSFIDLFAGIGGMRFAFERHGGTCVYTSEIDPFCRRTYLANIDVLHAFAGDIRYEAAKATIPPHDILLAGFPVSPSPSPACPNATRSVARTVLPMRRMGHCSTRSSTSSSGTSLPPFSLKTSGISRATTAASRCGSSWPR